MTKPQETLTSYSPEIFQALIEGAKRKIELNLPYNQAAYFRHRAHRLRHQMRLQNHEHAATVAQAKITITWPPTTPIRRTKRNVAFPVDISTPCTLTIAPADSEFTEALAKAGVTVTPLTPDLNSTPHTEDILAEFLKK